MANKNLKNFLNTVMWGFILWLFGYILGIVFFMFMPKEYIGLAIMPLGILFMLWVLLKKIKRDEFKCYIGLGVIWLIMAVVLDYFFLVKLFNSTDYYKLDVFIYYGLTLLIPIVVGIVKFRKKK